MCGEKDIDVIASAAQIGSPPHVRGKVVSYGSVALPFGITPACAGKSTIEAINRDLNVDHPRMCGEKYMGVPTKVEKPGSPPHVRGKESHARCKRQAHGITPACAGKRTLSEKQVLTRRDHPRMCGEKTKKIP